MQSTIMDTGLEMRPPLVFIANRVYKDSSPGRVLCVELGFLILTKNKSNRKNSVIL